MEHIVRFEHGFDCITFECMYGDYDGSSLNAIDAMYSLVNGGDAALWAFLDAYYDATFNGGEYPDPTEFKMSLRKADNSIPALDGGNGEMMV